MGNLTLGCAFMLNAVCVEDSEVLKVESQVLRRILDENPAIGYAVQKRISQIFFKRNVDAMERLRSIVLAVPMGPT